MDDKTNVSRADLSEQFDFLRHERRLRIPTSASTATFSSSGDDSVPNTAHKKKRWAPTATTTTATANWILTMASPL